MGCEEPVYVASGVVPAPNSLDTTIANAPERPSPPLNEARSARALRQILKSGALKLLRDFHFEPISCHTTNP